MNGISNLGSRIWKRKNTFSRFQIRDTVLILTLLLASCSESPFDRTRDASGGGALNKFGVAGSYVIFSDELKSGGGAFEYPGGENQSLSFNDTSNPISRRSIRYNWNGGDVSAPGCSPNPQHTFAGFDLMYTALQSDYNVSPSVPGRDLRQAGYTKVTFFARGSLSTATVVKIEVSAAGTPAGCPVPPLVPCITLSTNGSDDDPNFPCGVTGQLTGGWRQFSIPVTSTNLMNIKDYFKATYIFAEPIGSTAPGQGGTVYFDQIQYQ